MDEGQLPRRPPGMPQPPRHCTSCRQPFVVAGTRVVWVRGTLHAFDRCAGCGRESGRPATVEEWRHLGYIKQPHVRGMGVARRVDRVDEPRWGWADDGDDEEEAEDEDKPEWRTHEQAVPGWVVAVGLMLGGAGLAVLKAWADSCYPPDDVA